MVIQYLPDILKGVVQRVNQRTMLLDDPFPVYFGYGIYAQVSREVYKSETNNSPVFPLVWLVMGYDEYLGRRLGIYSSLECDMIIAMPTKTEYTMQQRTDISYKPKLIPVYDLLMDEISKERKFGNSARAKIEHIRKDAPYWGGGDVNGADTKNLFKNYIDAIHIKRINLTLKNIC